MKNSQMIKIADITVDEDLYPRTSVDHYLTVHQYKESMDTGEEFPPIDLHKKMVDGVIVYILIDGRHRLEANKRRKCEKILAIVSEGLSDGELFKRAILANARHGRKLSVQEKAAAAHRLLREFKFSKKDVSNVLSMPITSIENIIFSRIENVERVGLAALVMTKKGPVKNLLLGDNVPFAQEGLAARSQRQIFQQAITILENNALDLED